MQIYVLIYGYAYLIYKCLHTGYERILRAINSSVATIIYNYLFLLLLHFCMEK